MMAVMREREDDDDDDYGDYEEDNDDDEADVKAGSKPKSGRCGDEECRERSEW